MRLTPCLLLLATTTLLADKTIQSRADFERSPSFAKLHLGSAVSDPVVTGAVGGIRSEPGEVGGGRLGHILPRQPAVDGPIPEITEAPPGWDMELEALCALLAPSDGHSLREERAGILEYEGGMTRADAEQKARLTSSLQSEAALVFDPG